MAVPRLVMLLALILPLSMPEPCGAASAAVPCRPAQPATIDLRPKFTKGQELRYRMTMRSTGTTSMPGMDDPLADPAARPAPSTKGSPKAAAEPGQEMRQVVDVRFRVVDTLPEGGATVEMIYDALTLESKGPAGEMKFDSAQPASKDDPEAAALRAMIGTTLTLTVDADGAITGVTGGESLLPGWAGGGAALTGGGAAQAWGPIFGGRRSSGRAAVGDKWTTTDSLALSPIGSFSITTESVLARAGGGTAEVAFQGRIDPARESSPAAGGVQIRSASHVGRYVWDTTAGALRSLTMTQSMEAGGSLGGAEVSTTQRSETRIERLEGRGAAGRATERPAGSPGLPQIPKGR